MSNIGRVILLSLVMACAAVSVIAQRATPRDVVAAFYKFDEANSQVFNRRNIDARRRWLEFSLYDLLTKEIDREREFLKASPDDKPHFGDGLPFRPTEEMCDAGGKPYKRTAAVGEPIIVGAAASVPVTFAYPKACNIPALVYQAKLKEVKAKWLITDIQYPDGETLVKDLQRTQY